MSQAEVKRWEDGKAPVPVAAFEALRLQSETVFARLSHRQWDGCFIHRDIRAKTSTDTGNLAWSQSLLGHQNRAMTEHYTRARAGDVVQPLDRKL